MEKKISSLGTQCTLFPPARNRPWLSWFSTAYVAQRAIVPTVKSARPPALHFPCLGTPMMHRHHTLDTVTNLLYPVA